MSGRAIAVFIMVIGLLSAGQGEARAQEVWSGKDGDTINADARAVLIDNGAFYLATKNVLYKANESRDKWDEVFSIPRGENEINCVGGSGRTVYVGTRRGLFRSEDRGKVWRNVFRTFSSEKNWVQCIEVSARDRNKVMIGTQKGVFLSEDSGRSWKDISENLKNMRISAISINNRFVYAASDSGLYAKEVGQNGWQRLLVRTANDEDGRERSRPFPTSDEIGEEEAETITCVAISGERVFAGFGKKILFSDDHGKTWKNFSMAGISGAVNCMLARSGKEEVYCATSKGVFQWCGAEDRWRELKVGGAKKAGAVKLLFDDDNVGNGRDLGLQSRPSLLWAVTERGVYRLEGGRFFEGQTIDVEKNIKDLNVIFENEPDFRNLQQAALRYAELGPDKIKNWRREARMKAFMPKVSFGLDTDKSNTSEIYTSATRDYVIAGPDDITSGWDVSVSWELADLIWSDDQTNIDVRSRLTTQLRNDVLDDLRRIYFERKRVQFELMMEPPKDLKARFDKEMRFRELTQAIDDLTGNYLSDHVKK